MTMMCSAPAAVAVASAARVRAVTVSELLSSVPSRSVATSLKGRPPPSEGETGLGLVVLMGRASPGSCFFTADRRGRCYLTGSSTVRPPR